MLYLTLMYISDREWYVVELANSKCDVRPRVCEIEEAGVLNHCYLV